VYTSEEPTRYGLGCLGSRALAGCLRLEDTKELKDMGGKTLYEKLKELNYDVDNKFSELVKQPGEVYASLELHIEQNSRLEKAGIPIGIVTKICAPSNYNVTVTGVQSHAGGTSMEDRHDAYAASCEMALALEKIAKESVSEYNTATIGIVNVIPGGVNVIPGECTFTVDIRDCNWQTKQATIARFMKEFEEIAKRRGVSVVIEEENNDIPLTCDSTIREMLKQACGKRQLEYMELVSGPFHDSLFVGRFAPAAMIFVPSLNGISHSPKEWTDYEDLAKGADVLTDTLVILADQ
ncbi:MAG: hydantoinase/carbamoylase family amidase, partial [Lachnospiraceae bacterium]|nr:hydantoinase/carbamoylase family amidase [Lachnospiraceae bacterium]